MEDVRAGWDGQGSLNQEAPEVLPMGAIDHLNHVENEKNVCASEGPVRGKEEADVCVSALLTCQELP